MEVDGVLGERHDAVIQGGVGRGRYVLCAPAFRPLVGKQHVAWRFMQPDTLVYAVRMAGATEAAVLAATSHDASAAAAEEEEEQEEEEEKEEEEKEEGGAAHAVSLPPPPPQLQDHGAYGGGSSMHTIRVSCPS